MKEEFRHGFTGGCLACPLEAENAALRKRVDDGVLCARSVTHMMDFEMELAGVADVLNQELRENGPIEVEQYKPGQLREGIRKLSDYLKAKVWKREEKIESIQKRAEAADAMVFDARRDYEAEKVRAESAEKELIKEKEFRLRVDSVAGEYCQRALAAENRGFDNVKILTAPTGEKELDEALEREIKLRDWERENSFVSANTSACDDTKIFAAAVCSLRAKCGEWSEKWTDAGYEILELQGKLDESVKALEHYSSKVLYGKEHEENDQDFMLSRAIYRWSLRSGQGWFFTEKPGTTVGHPWDVADKALARIRGGR